MNRLSIDLSSMPSSEFNALSSIAITLPVDVQGLTAARLAMALNGRLDLSTGGPCHEIVITVEGSRNPVKAEGECECE